MYQSFLYIIKITALQLIGLFGIFFIFGFILSKLQEKTQQIYKNTLGWKGILWTAWIGTPFHEFGHYFFAKIFRHKIIKVKIFDPNESSGELGRVDHSFNKHSIFQRLGNFFIGAAPMIFGSFVLALLAYLFLPGGKTIFTTLSSTDSLGSILYKLPTDLYKSFLSFEAITSWNYWLFLYLSFCIASHIAPSKADRKGMWNGFVYIILLFILLNIIGLLLKIDPTGAILKIREYLNILTVIFVYSTIISSIHFLFAYTILQAPKNILKGRLTK